MSGPDVAVPLVQSGCDLFLRINGFPMPLADDLDKLLTGQR